MKQPLISSRYERQRKALPTDRKGNIDDGTTPTPQGLRESLVFSPDDGRIWLNDQRMLLWRSSTYGALRCELVSCLGLDHARSLLTRVGYTTGGRDVELVHRTWPDSDPTEAFHAGLRQLRLAGIVRPEMVALDFDVGSGDFYAEFLLHDSHEDDEHIASFGIGTEPGCWMTVGYSSGYASAFMGKRVIFREVSCLSSGGDVCRIIGRPAEEWDDPEQDLRYFKPEASATRMRRSFVSVASQTAGRNDSTERKETGVAPLVGISSSFSAARHLIERVASTSATVLFTGPSGAGKELFAQTLHAISPRAEAPFVAINCAAIPDTLIESELFGVERGAYTGAVSSRPGRFERAEGGTLFLDEIASLSFVAQGKLLRALQERRIERVGGTREIEVDVRVVAATNVDLRDEVSAGRFREDLFFRLNVFPISLPPLKERRDDIPLLMELFLRRYSVQHKREVPGFTSRAVQALLQYEFPGNIRELQNLVERGLIMAEKDEPIDVHHLFREGEVHTMRLLSLAENGHLVQTGTIVQDAPIRKNEHTGADSNTGELSAKEVATYRKALVANRYNVAATARALGLTRAQLAYRLKRYGLL
ncbi:sigma-54-dependent Fis family transcriptional regulator [Paraburkholderia sp. Ac-20347]|uniref:sigma-54-dependent Fis family transcriptional regulator n=1 Tax=Paraburkholderia sp. Ac-20347 TaxID=2703892 RepID=UPI00197E1584|nr:sigma-54-dependent Fis family transcriptional regulator [Paraburkholderia sp. Ac-20347]MBN3813740.1 AAA domain-containing protein [Paraburkholderia sp. Ac-20347]